MSVKTLPYAAALALLSGILASACAGSTSDSTETSSSAVSAPKLVEAPLALRTGNSMAAAMTSTVAVRNLCASQAANTFHCIDDTSFQLCTGNDNFVVNSCPKGFCATRHPAHKNPCIGAARARQIDGVDPTPAGT